MELEIIYTDKLCKNENYSRGNIPERTKRIQRTPMNRRKLTLKDYPEKKKREIGQKAKKKKVLHLDSTFRPLSVEQEQNN